VDISKAVPVQHMRSPNMARGNRRGVPSAHHCVRADWNRSGSSRAVSALAASKQKQFPRRALVLLQ